MSWIRARQPGQKEERRQSILDAAADLLDSGTADRVSLGQIASRCGFAKSNIYRYFESREEIFITLYLLDTERWIRSLTGSFSGLPLNPDPEAIANLLFETYQKIPRLAELLPWVYLSFAPSLSTELGDQFRELDQRQNDRFVDSVLVVLPDLDTTATTDLFRQIRGTLSGLGPMVTWRSGTADSGPTSDLESGATPPPVGDSRAEKVETEVEESLVRTAILHLCRESLRQLQNPGVRT